MAKVTGRVSVKFRRKLLMGAASWLCATVCVLISGLPMAAQGGVKPVAADPGVTLYVPMRVKDSDRLRSLKSGDLVVTDAGRVVDSRAMRLSTAPPSGPPVVSFIFDRMPSSGAHNARRFAEEMLNACSGHAMLAGVWSIDTQLELMQPFIDDTSKVRKALAREGGKSQSTAAPDDGSVPLPESQRDASTRILLGARRIVSDGHAPWSYATVMATAQVQRQRPGRKAVVLFTARTSSDVNASDRYRELRQALKDANISLFVVDVNTLDAEEGQQLMASSAMGAQATSNYYAGLAAMHSTAPLASTMGMGAMEFQAMKDTITNIEMGNGRDESNPLAEAAKASGGVYSYVDAGAKKLGEQMVAELTSFVTIAYAIPGDQRDGRYHTVSIKSTRPDVIVAAQPGYFAAVGQGETRSSVASLRGAPMEGDPALLEKDATAAELPFQTAVLHFGGASGGLRAEAAMEVPLAGLRLREDEHTRLYSVRATLDLAIVDTTGKTVTRFEEEFRRRGAIENEGGLAGEVLGFARPVNLPPGAYTLQGTVRDWNAETWSRRSQPLEVSAADAASPMSDLLVVRGMQAAKEGGEEFALQYGEKQIIPNLAGELAGDMEKATFFFQVYGAHTASDEPRTLTVAIVKDGQPLSTLPLKTGETQLDALSTHLITVPLDRGAGTYQATAQLRRGTEVIERRVTVVVPETRADMLADKNLAASRELAMESGLTAVSGAALAPAQSAALLEAARGNALMYTDRLPNFMCNETLVRSADHGGTGAWKMRDTIVESLQYRDKVEQRTVVRVNGEKSSLAAENVEGAHSNGEFGSLLRAIFEPEAKAEFTWLKTEESKGERLEVYRFKVAAERSQFTVTDHTNLKLRAAFHGFVFLDSETRTVRRLMMESEALPRNFGVKLSWIAMNYEYVTINEHDYLLPSYGEVGLRQGKREVLLNQLVFSDYRRFGARSRVVAGVQSGEDAPH